MQESTTGLKRIKGKLPENQKVAHRAGTSFTREDGLIGAVNSVGIMDFKGHDVTLAIFVKNSVESFEITENIIAEIAWEIWNEFVPNFHRERLEKESKK